MCCLTMLDARLTVCAIVLCLYIINLRINCTICTTHVMIKLFNTVLSEFSKTRMCTTFRRVQIGDDGGFLWRIFWLDQFGKYFPLFLKSSNIFYLLQIEIFLANVISHFTVSLWLLNSYMTVLTVAGENMLEDGRYKFKCDERLFYRVKYSFKM